MAEEQDVLGAELAQKMNHEIAQLLVDAPPRTDIDGSGVQNQIIYVERNPQRWADICQYALGFHGIADERMVELEIEVANGMRRPPDKRPDIALERLEGVKPYLNALPDDVWKTHLVGLWAYHGAIVHEDMGQYAKSAECHHATANLDTDEFSVLRAKYMAARAILLNDILRNPEQNNPSSYQQFYCAGEDLVEVLYGKQNNKLRWFGNVMMHRGQIEIFIGRNDDISLTRFNYLPDHLQKIFLPQALLAEAIEAKNRHGRICMAQAAFELAGRTGDVAAEALLVILKTYQNWILRGNSERYDDADKTARQIITLEGYGGYIPKKIAANWLESRLGC